MAGPVEQQIHRDPALLYVPSHHHHHHHHYPHPLLHPLTLPINSYWILLPITVVMILTGILRHYLSTLLQTTPKRQPLPKIREQRSLARAQNLRTNHAQISSTSFQRRKEAFIEGAKEGRFLADPDARGQPKANPLSDPAAMEGMMGMMKGQVAMMVPQSLIMGWINAFFSGYVISTLPLLHPSSPSPRGRHYQRQRQDHSG